MLLAKYTPASGFMCQLAVARAGKRRLTGVGIFVDLSMPLSTSRVGNINAEVTTDYRTKMPAPDDLVGFTLFIRDGVLSLLEGYTYGDVAWPDDPMEEWLILDPAKVPHQKAK